MHKSQMPIIHIHATQTPDSAQLSKIILKIRLKSSEALQCSIDNIWVIFQNHSQDHYVQFDQAPSNPLVIIQANEGRSLEMRTRFVEAVTHVISEGLSISKDSIWIHYQEMKPQNIWYQGKWTG